MVGDARLAKPLGVPIGLTVEPGNTHDGKHMMRTFGQVRKDLTGGSTMIFDAGANNKAVLDMVVEDGEHFNPLNEAVLGCYGLFSEAPAV